MITLNDKASGAFIGSITEAQLQYLVDELEEEHRADQDYYFHRSQLEIFRENGADGQLVGLLESAMGEADELEVIWSRE
jgi:S-methylmethionine-dependent homocysteine/selenocysteine methylase